MDWTAIVGDGAVSQPDIILKRSSTRVVETLDVTSADDSTTPRHRLDPSTSTVTVSGDRVNHEPTARIESGDETALATLSYAGTEGYPTGRLQLNTHDSTRTIDLTTDTGSGRIEVREEGQIRARIAGVITGGVETPRPGGRASIHYDDGTEAVVAKAVPARIVEASTGVLEVNDTDGNTTGRLVGRDAALELTGDAPEAGELVIVGERFDGPDDIFVHATGDDQSEWGADTGNVPRITLDGRNARVRLGRGPLEGQRDGIAGRLSLRSEGGEYVTLAPREGDNYVTGAISYRHGTSSSGGGGLLTAVRSTNHRETGLLFITGTKSLLVGSNLNVTQQGIDQAAISKVGPRIWPDEVEVAFTEVAEIELSVGDGTSARIRIDESWYRLEATLNPGTDGRVWLRFRTAAVGDRSQPTVEVLGDASITDLQETDLNQTPESYRLELHIEGEYGTDTVRLEVG